MTDDEIRLVVPAAPGWARLARLTGAGLASRLGFAYDDVEDVRIAVGEACSLLSDAESDADTHHPQLAIEFRITDDALHVTAHRAAVDPDESVEAGLSRQILEAVADSFELGPGRVSFTKRRGTDGT